MAGKRKKNRRRKTKSRWVDWPRLLYGIPSALLAVLAVSVVVAGRQVQIDVAEDDIVTVADRCVDQAQQVLRLLLRLDEMKPEWRVYVCRGNLLHALEHLYATLRLPGFRGFVAKAVDIGLDVPDFFLLTPVHGLLPGEGLGPNAFETAVVALVQRDGAVFQVGDPHFLFIDPAILLDLAGKITGSRS